MMTKDRDPSGLLDAVMAQLDLKNDAALARKLRVAPPVISKLRNEHMPVGSSFILKYHEIGGLSLPVIRGYIGGQA